MPIAIEGEPFYTTKEVMESLGISRQTLWRWRSTGRVPKGRRFRDGQTIFSEAEWNSIRVYANSVEPIDLSSPDQLKLFTRTR